MSTVKSTERKVGPRYNKIVTFQCFPRSIANWLLLFSPSAALLSWTTLLGLSRGALVEPSFFSKRVIFWPSSWDVDGWNAELFDTCIEICMERTDYRSGYYRFCYVCPCLPPPPLLAWALFVLLLSTLVCCQSTELIWGFLFHKFPILLPPPP